MHFTNYLFVPQYNSLIHTYAVGNADFVNAPMANQALDFQATMGDIGTGKIADVDPTMFYPQMEG